MLDIKYIRENKELVKKNNVNRRVEVDVDRLLILDDQRRTMLQKAEELRALRNQKSKGKPSTEEITKMRTVGDEIAKLEGDIKNTDLEYRQLMLKIPNLSHSDVTIGGEEDFKILDTSGSLPKFDFEAKDHEQLALALDLLDFERGAKVAGNKFYFVKNDLVRLNQALINYGIDIVAKHGFMLLETPDLAKDEILEGIGFNPRGPESQIYSIEKSDLNLIGTAEITVGGYHADEILDLSSGPIKYAAISHCFRTEAGAYGRTSKGLYRVHQFSKLEMFVFCKPADSENMHEEILNIEKEIINGLELPYQVIDIASGDLGGPAYRKYDIEAWMVMRSDQGGASTEASRPNVKGGYGEVTSTSNCTDFQARRLNTRYRGDDNKPEFVHTLNGTAINTSRWPIAIIENYQTKEGTIKIPKVLQKYMGGQKEIK